MCSSSESPDQTRGNENEGREEIQVDIDALSEFFAFGFILGNKTLVKSAELNQLPIPEVRHIQNATMDKVYKAIVDSVKETAEQACRPFLSLSGGIDSRIIAGIMAEEKLDVPTVTFGSQWDRTIADKICRMTGLRNHFVEVSDIPPTDLARIAKKTMGITNVMQLALNPTISRYVRDNNIGTSSITGAGGDEILGGYLHSKCNDSESFRTMLINRSRAGAARRLVKSEYLKQASENLLTFSEGLNIDEIFFRAFVNTRRRQLDFESAGLLRMYAPYISSRVMSAVYSIPYKKRINKQLQRRILKKRFPKLYKLRWSWSNLPVYFPFKVHVGVFYVTRKIDRKFGKKRRALPFDHALYFMKHPEYSKLILDNLPEICLKESTREYVGEKKGEYEEVFGRLLTYALVFGRLEQESE